MSTHLYTTTCSWSGSTGVGYEQYDRSHTGSAPPALASLELSSDVAFGGDPAKINPEQLVVLAASSCQMLSFLAAAARARVDVVGYDDTAIGEMPEDDSPVRLVRITLHPNITVRGTTEDERLRHLCEVAHRECYVANSLGTTIGVQPTFRRVSPPDRGS